MRIAIPISAHDTHLLSESVAVMVHFGLLQNHCISLLPTHSQVGPAEEAASQLLSVCDDVKVLPLEFEGDGRWPQSPNLHFAMAMEALRQSGNREPIFWKELDCEPTQLKWADTLENAWRAGRAPFCGKIVLKPSRNALNEIVYENDDLMMMGCAIYPPNMMALPQIQVLFKGFYSMQNADPWDVYMRGWMRTLGWSGTDLIGDRWNTVNYRMESGAVICDPGPTEFTSRDHSQTDVSGACVIHGCKDGSLARLILSGEFGEGAPAIPKAPEEPKTDAPAAALPPKYEEDLKSLWKAQGELLARVAKLEKLVSEPTATAPPPAPRQAAPPPPATRNIPESLATIPGPRSNGNRPDIETIRGMIATRPIQIGALAHACGMDKEELRAIIGKPDSQILLIKGWAKLDT